MILGAVSMIVGGLRLMRTLKEQRANILGKI
jgi:hypothetical protein